MGIRSKVRTLVSSVVVFGLALPILSAGLSTAQAAAPTQPLVINEINWAGSYNNPVDQWMELYNPGSTVVNFMTDPYTLVSGTTPLLTLSSGWVAPHGFFVISRLAPGNSTLTSSDLASPSLILSATASYALQDSTGTVIDRAGNGNSVLAGSAGTPADWPTASMSRSAWDNDGTLLGSWYTAHTIGSGFDAQAVQYGTPGTYNHEVAAPYNVAISPLSPPSSNPTVTGKVVSTAGQMDIPFVNVTFYRVSDGLTVTTMGVVSAIDNSFSVMSPTLAPGMYRIGVTALDGAAFANRSAATVVVIPGSPQNLYTVNPSPVVVVTPPVLNPYPALVNVSTVTLTGTVQAGTALVVSINGNHYSTTAVAGAQTAFSLPVTLIANTLNRIEVRAVDSNGNASQPAVAEITNDSTAPAALVSSLVIVNNNPTGTVDTVVGKPGSAEAGATVILYADQALTQVIGSGLVAADGSFGPLAIGDNAYATVYAVVKDVVGNVSPATALVNGISFVGQTIALPVSSTNSATTSLTVSWQPVPGAVNYRLKYRIDGGAYSAPIDLCMPSVPCSLTRTLVNLKPGTRYTVAIAAVDQFGNVSNYSEQVVQTTALGVGGSPNGVLPLPSLASSSTGSTGSTAYTGTSTPTPAPTETIQPKTTPTPTPSASPSSEEGNVKSADDTAGSRNWTPWIILAVLVGLALLATAGYFYWFGAETPEAEAESTAVRRDEEKVGDQKEPPKEKKANEREKRW